MEREFTDYLDWVNSGADRTYGGGVTDTPIYGETPNTSMPVDDPFRIIAPPNSGGGGGGARSPEDAEREGRAYDEANGLVGGYMMNGQWVNGSPRSGGGGGGGGFGGGGGAFPGFNWRGFSAPDRFSPKNAEFSYEAFAPSNYSDLEAQPGYLEGEKRLQKQIMAEKAFQGMARSGMAIGDLWSGLDRNREQRFAEFDNRRFRNYDTNRRNALESFQTNYGVERDSYDRYADSAYRQNDYNFGVDKAENDAILSRWLEQVRSLTSLARPVD